MVAADASSVNIHICPAQPNQLYARATGAACRISVSGSITLVGGVLDAVQELCLSCYRLLLAPY
jgi:hypothetical protein